MGAAECRKNANFGGGSNPWGPRHPHSKKRSKILQKKYKTATVFEPMIVSITALNAAFRPSGQCNDRSTFLIGIIQIQIFL